MKLIVYNNGKGELTWSDSLATLDTQASDKFYVFENLINVNSNGLKADLISWNGLESITKSIVCKVRYLREEGEGDYIGFIEIMSQFKSTNTCTSKYLVVHIPHLITIENRLKLTVPDVVESGTELEMKFKFNPSYGISIRLIYHSISNSKAQSILYNNSDYPEVNKGFQDLINSTDLASMNTDNSKSETKEVKDDHQELESIIETEMNNLANQIKTSSENIINAIKSDPKVKKEVNKLNGIKQLFKDHVKKFCDEVKTVMED